MIKEAIYKIIRGMDLTEDEAFQAMVEIIEGQGSHPQISSFLTGLRIKGPTIPEIVGAAKAVRERVTRLSIEDDLIVIDREEINLDDETIFQTALDNTKGTKTFNISTATAFVVAGAGARVAKSGNMAPSDYVGSENVLRALGIELDVTTTLVERCIEEVGLGFLYTPMFQGIWRHTFEVRRQMGFRTLFNTITPLCNPAGAKRFFLGVYEPERIAKIAQVLKGLDITKGVIVHGEHSLDEVSITGKSLVCELTSGEPKTYELFPEDVGLTRAKPEDIMGRDAKENAKIIQRILNGDNGARRDVVLFNSSLALVAAGKAENIQKGLQMAKEAIDSGNAKAKLEEIIRLTNERAFVRSA
jgi:anthranilate phosphoribosyltransferase